jgi:hypothetical protein
MQEIEIPKICYRYPSAVEQIDVQELVTPLVKMTWNNGIFQYLKGAEYPMKGLTKPEVMWALSLAKRNLIQMMRLLSKWYFYPTYLIIAILPWKQKVKIMDRFIKSFCEGNYRNITPYILKTNYMTPLCQEIEWLTFTFLDNLGIPEETRSQFSEMFAAMIDYDNAYRYRVGDIFSETNKTRLLENPEKEIMRLIKLFVERTAGGHKSDIALKFKYMAYGLRILLLHPKIKKAFRIAISEIDVRKMELDEADRYWVALRENNEYAYLGLWDDERRKLIDGKSVPLLIKRSELGL